LRQVNETTLLKRIEVKKEQVLLRKDDLDSKVYQVESRMQRSYAVDDNGKEHIFMFVPENWIVADSTPPDQPDELFVDALRNYSSIQKYCYDSRAAVLTLTKDQSRSYSP
jgi:hypothetical protein